jgi:predicted transcriptional regulator
LQDKLDSAVKTVSELKEALIFDPDFDDDVLDLMAKYEFIIGLDLLEQAAMAFRKSHLHQTRALAQSPRP